ncbi:MAG: hypothetical protein KDJ41_16100 [Hyphomicrobiaceae bacterium]|nr:hypothetical protein [Hyphomicrobiaceae bacterium]
MVAPIEIEASSVNLESHRDFCFEDFVNGQVFQLGTRRVSREAIKEYAREFDPQPFHMDEQAAATTLLKGLAASGWHTASLLMRLFSDGVLAHTRYAGLLGVEEIRWLLPVRPDDVLTGRAICLGPRMEMLGRDHGVIDMRCEAFNGAGQRLLWWHGHAAFHRRHGSDPQIAAWTEPDIGRRVARNPVRHGVKYFEDVEIGDEIALGTGRFGDDEIAYFHREFDPYHSHPVVAAGRSECASGWHVASMWMQKLTQYYAEETARLKANGRPVPALGPSPGIRRLFWHRPVCLGDSIAFTTWAERKLELPAPTGWGLLVGGAEARNQRGEIVMSFAAHLLLERRDRTDRSVSAQS